ncbi:MAG: hypothetical protein WCF84_03100, partial [Anaerolineae bacterium]
MRRECANAIKPQIMLGLLAVVILTGCTAWGWGATPTPTLEPSLIDSSILTGIPCVAPCWYGLEIGRSTKSDILAVAQTLSFVDPKSFPEEPVYYWDLAKQANTVGTQISLRCRQPEDSSCVSLVVVNNVLKQIYVSPP